MSDRTSIQSLPDGVTPRGPGFGWDNDRLILFDGSRRRHVASPAVIPVLLDLGLGFFALECEEITAAPLGLPIQSEDDLKCLTKPKQRSGVKLLTRPPHHDSPQIYRSEKAGGCPTSGER